MSLRIEHGTRLVRPLAGHAGARPARPAGTAADGRGGSWQMASTSSGSRPRTRPGTGGRLRVPVRVDRTAGWLRWAPSAFYPQDLDALARTARATFKLGRAATTSPRGRRRQGGCRPVPPGPAAADAPERSAGPGMAGTGERIDGRSGHVPHRPPRGARRHDHAPAADHRRCLRDRHLVDAAAAGRPLVVTIRSTEALSSRPTVTLDQTGPPAGPPVRDAGRPRPVHGPVHAGPAPAADRPRSRSAPRIAPADATRRSAG